MRGSTRQNYKQTVKKRSKQDRNVKESRTCIDGISRCQIENSSIVSSMPSACAYTTEMRQKEKSATYVCLLLFFWSSPPSLSFYFTLSSLPHYPLYSPLWFSLLPPLPCSPPPPLLTLSTACICIPLAMLSVNLIMAASERPHRAWLRIAKIVK